MQHFSRRETVILTRTSPGRLAYLARIGIVVPTNGEGTAAKHVYYSWEQVLELRAIRHLRCQLSLQMIRKVLACLEGIGGDRTLRNKQLIVDHDEVTWVKTEDDTTPTAIQVAAKANCHVGQLTLMSEAAAFAPTDQQNAPLCSKVIDFENFRRRVVPFRPHKK